MKNKKLLFHISGEKGSGKSTLLSWFADDGYFTTEVRLHLEKALKDGEFVADKIPIKFWWTEEMVKFCQDYIKEHTLVFLTGLYHKDELAYFKSAGYDTHSIGVICDEILRYKRIIKRARDCEIKLNLENLREKDRKRNGTEAGFEKSDISNLIRYSEIILFNNNSVKEFRQEYLKLRKYILYAYRIK
ncbi:MAG: hypothetical protein Q8R00_01135 [Candidatus Nanoarchaeia archaeon]|nr:hypothetical protein [Candidatus Nanoarchaeia archaeon]